MSIRNHPVTPVVLGVLGIAIWLLAWQWFTAWGPLSGVRGLPTAIDTVSISLELLGRASFWQAVGDTLLMAAAGLFAALVIGVTLGMVMGLSRVVNQLLDPMVQFLRPVPPVVILPLLLLVLGPTPQLGIVLAAFAALWPILTQTLVGVMSIDPVAKETAYAMRLGWLQTQRRLVLPGSVPSIATGVRIAGSAALLLAIGVGLLGGAPGLGRSILLAQQVGDSALVFAIMLWSGVIGLLISLLLSWLERVMTRGHRPTEARS